MISIPVEVWRISRIMLKRHYLRKKKFFLIFYCISEIWIKCRTFWNKSDYPNLIISEISKNERGGYLKV